MNKLISKIKKLESEICELDIKNIEAFDPNLSIVVFRYISSQVDPNLFNYTLHQELLDDGTIFLSSTRINDKYYLRFACLSIYSHLQNVDLGIDILHTTIKIPIGVMHCKLLTFFLDMGVS